MATIQELASKMYDALVWDKRNDGTEFVKLRDGSPQWMTDVIHEAHGDKYPDDTVYYFVYKAACALSDYEGDYIEDAISEIEPDIYTSRLTAWLHERVDHIDYLQQAIDDGWDSDATQAAELLMRAQSKQIEEVGYALHNALQQLSADQDEGYKEDDPEDGDYADERDHESYSAAPAEQDTTSFHDGVFREGWNGLLFNPFAVPTRWRYEALRYGLLPDNDYWSWPTDPNVYGPGTADHQGEQ